MKITITGAQLAGIEQHARRALPDEACGLITGALDDRGDAVVAAVHPSENMAACGSSFEIDPGLHMGLQRDLRGSGEEIIGVYHSHPSGPAEPSARDADAAGAGAYGGWVWLITAPAAPGTGGQEAAVTHAFLHVSGNVPGHVRGNGPGHAGEKAPSPAIFEAVEIRVQGEAANPSME